jgi:hypothetical protein
MVDGGTNDATSAVTARDIPLHTDIKITGKLSIQSGSIFIALSDGNTAVVEALKPPNIATTMVKNLL